MQPQRTIPWARPLGTALTALHLLAVCWLTSRPLSAAWIAAGNFTPLHTIRADLAMGPVEAVRHLVGGMALLAPLGVLLPLAGGRVDVPGAVSFARTVFAGLMLAFGAEVVRNATGSQIFDVDAVLLHTAGVALAHLLVVPAARSALRRRGYGRRRPAQGPARTMSGVGVAP